MIIYKRKKKQLVIPCGLGPVVCPDIDHTLQQKIVDSSTVLQQIEPDEGYYGLYRVIINPLTDDNLLPGNIRAGVTILGVLGTYSGELINLQAKTVDPTLQGLVVSADIGYDGLSSVTVNPVTADIDPDIQPENIKKDVEILGVIGTFEGGPLQSKTVNSSTASQTVEPDNGNYGLSSVTVNPYTLESKTQNITLNGTYSFTPTSADGLSSVDISVNVADIPAVVQSKSVTYDANGEYTVTPDQGYDGLSSVDISVNVPAAQPTLQAKTVNSSTANQTVTPDQGYDGLSEVDINALTDPNLLSNNIKKDVTIFGITGTFNGDPQLQQKTVNSSTASQTVQSDSGYDGLSEVIVNPYTVESDSSTLTQNGIYSFSPVNADALSGVTVNVSVDGQVINNQNKTVNPSTNSQSITADQGYTGLGTVTVNPMNLENKFDNPYTYASAYVDVTADSGYDGLSKVRVFRPKNDSITVNSSTVTQEITPASRSTDYFNKVTVNPYTVETDSSTLTANGTYTFTPQNADALSSVTVDVSVDGQVINNQNKTVDPSTSGQTITADSGYTGLGTVTVNPVNAVYGSETITQNGTYGFDGTVFGGDYIDYLEIDVSVDNEPELQNKTVNSSTSIQILLADPSYYGLNQVTINPYTLDSKTVDPSTNSITVNSSTDGMYEVTVNAVTAAIDPDIIPGNIRTGVDILGVVGTYGGGYSNDWYFAARRGAITDASAYSIDPANYTTGGVPYSFKDSQLTVLPDFSNVTTMGNGAEFTETFRNTKIQHANFPALKGATRFNYTFANNKNLVDASFPVLESAAMTGAFADCSSLTTFSFPSAINTTSTNSFLNSVFVNCNNLESYSAPNLGTYFRTEWHSNPPQDGYSINSPYDASMFFECNSLRTLSIPWTALRHSYFEMKDMIPYDEMAARIKNPLHSARLVRDINFTEISGKNYRIYGGMQLNWNKWLSDQTILDILQYAGEPVPGILINEQEIRDFDVVFYDEGLTVLDTSLGAYQSNYDRMENLGYTIHNLTINQSDNLILTSPKRIEPQTNAVLNLDLQQTISFDSSLAWTASVSDASVSISSASGSSGSNTINVSYENGWTGDALVTITNGQCTRKVKVKKPNVTYIPLDYIDMGKVHLVNGYLELGADLRQDSAVDIKFRVFDVDATAPGNTILSTNVRGLGSNNPYRAWNLRTYNGNIRFYEGNGPEITFPYSGGNSWTYRPYWDMRAVYENGKETLYDIYSGTPTLMVRDDSSFGSTEGVNLMLYPGDYRVHDIKVYYYGVNEGVTHHYKPVMVENVQNTNDFKIGMYDELNDQFFEFIGYTETMVRDILLQVKSVDASLADQTVTPDNGFDGLSEVVVKAVDASIDSNIQAGNIKNGVTILGVQGTFAGGTLQSKSADSSTVSQTVTPDSGNYGLSSVIINPYTLETDSSTLTQNGTYTFTPQNADALSSVTIDVSVEGEIINNQSKTVDCSTASQTVTFDSGYTGLSSVTVNAANLQVINVGPSTSYYESTPSLPYIGYSKVEIMPVTASIDQNIQAGNIKNGVTILGVTGNYTGTVINNQNKTVNSSTSSQTVTYDSGYTGLNQVTVNAVTSSIDSNITAGNIKKDVVILGVTGTYEGGDVEYDAIYDALAQI